MSENCKIKMTCEDGMEIEVPMDVGVNFLRRLKEKHGTGFVEALLWYSSAKAEVLTGLEEGKVDHEKVAQISHRMARTITVLARGDREKAFQIGDDLMRETDAFLSLGMESIRKARDVASGAGGGVNEAEVDREVARVVRSMKKGGE